MTISPLDAIGDDVAYIRTRVDELHNDLSNHRVQVEHRVSKLEVKSGFWGVIGGLLAGIALRLGV